MLEMKFLTTLKLTSASNKANLISRRVASISASESFPRALSFLKTAMRYAGPREAVFHAIIRKNFGCTHFVVGRDHAGVGNYYGKYSAHSLLDKFSNLGIEILKLRGPYYCKKCRQIVTEDTCGHGERHAVQISGTSIRDVLRQGRIPSEELMRKEISRILLKYFKKGKAFNENDKEKL